MDKQKSDYSILAVDDSDIIINLIQILMESQGYQFTSAECAPEALSVIKQQHFDLILLDIEMPEMSGIDLLTEMNQQCLLKDTKVVMLTGKTDVEHVKQCLELGAVSYILKPFDHETMMHRIWEILQDS
jgi:CheY-like chemotaxis protein